MTTSLLDSFATPARYEQLIRSKRILNSLVPMMDKAERCGIDCQQFRQGHGYMNEQADNILREFYPNQVLPPTGSGIPSTGE